MLIKTPLLHQGLGPRVFLSLSLSLYFWLIPWSVKAGCITQGILASFLLSLSHRRLWTTRFWSNKGSTSGAQKQGLGTRGFGRSDPRGPIEVSKYWDMGLSAGEPPHFSTLFYHLFKVQGFSVSHQRIEACRQTVVECNPWFPDEGSFDLKIWHWVKRILNELSDREKTFWWISGPYGLSLKPRFCHYKVVLALLIFNNRQNTHYMNVN